MEEENLFDSDSFNDEITNASEAKSCYTYFTNNLTSFRHSLADKGLSYEDIQDELRTCWLNLLTACQKVGFTNSHLERMAKAYGRGVNKAIPKK